MLIYYIIDSIDSYMYRTPIVTIFKEVFFDGILHTALEAITYINRYDLGKGFKIYIRI